MNTNLPSKTVTRWHVPDSSLIPGRKWEVVHASDYDRLADEIERLKMAFAARAEFHNLDDLALIEQLRAKLDPANREPPHCSTCDCGLPDETTSPQAPIVKLTVGEDDTLKAEFYAPSLPPGVHDLYCEPPTPGGQKVPFFEPTAVCCVLPVITVRMLADFGQEGFFEKTEEPVNGVTGVSWSQAAVDFACLIQMPAGKTSVECDCPAPGTSNSTVSPFCPVHAQKAREHQ